MVVDAPGVEKSVLLDAPDRHLSALPVQLYTETRLKKASQYRVHKGTTPISVANSCLNPAHWPLNAPLVWSHSVRVLRRCRNVAGRTGSKTTRNA